MNKNRFLSSLVFYTGSYARGGLLAVLLLYLGIILWFSISLRIQDRRLAEEARSYSQSSSQEISATLSGIVDSLSSGLQGLERRDSGSVHKYVRQIIHENEQGYLSTAFNWERDSLQIRYAYCQNGELLRSDRIPLSQSHPYYKEIRSEGRARITPPYTDQVCHDQSIEQLVVSVAVPLIGEQEEYRGMVVADFDLQGFLEKLLPDTGSYQVSFLWRDGDSSYQQLSGSGLLSQWNGSHPRFSDFNFLPPGQGGPFEIGEEKEFQVGGFGYYYYPFQNEPLQGLEGEMGFLLIRSRQIASFRWEWVLLATLLLLPFLAFLWFADRQQRQILQEIRNFSALVYAAKDQQQLIEQVFAFLKNWNPRCQMVVMAELRGQEGRLSFVAEEFAKENRIAIRSLEDLSGQAERSFRLDDPEISWRPFVQCLSSGKVLFFDDYHAYLAKKPAAAASPDEGALPKSLLVVPIWDGEGRIAGAFSMQSKESRAFAPRDRFLLEKLGGVALLTLEKLRAMQELRESLSSQLALNEEKKQALEAIERLQSQQTELYLLFLHQIRSFPIKVNDLLQTLKAEESSLLPQPVQKIRELTARINEFFQAFAPYLRSEINELPLRPEYLDLQRVIKGIWHQYRPLAVEKELEFIQEGDPRIQLLADPLFLKAILQVILHNAIKFSPGKGSIHVHSQVNQGEVHIAIKDQGPGIGPEKIAVIQEMLEKGNIPENAARFHNESGLGLGLFLAARMAKKIGAVLAIDCPEDQGCTLHVTLSLK